MLGDKSHIIPHEDPDEPEALAQWLTLTNSSPKPSSHLQSEWDKPILEQLSASLLVNAQTPKDKARILASNRKEAGAWLNALPSPNLGTLLSDSSMQFASAWDCQSATHTVAAVVEVTSTRPAPTDLVA